jgi:hypothetical protein
MIEPAHHLIRLLDDANGEKLFDRAVTMPGIPRIGDNVRIDGELWTVARVVWEPNRGNWTEVRLSYPEEPRKS